VRGQELIYIPKEEADKLRSKAELLADMSQRLRPFIETGVIRKDEAAFIMKVVGGA